MAFQRRSRQTGEFYAVTGVFLGSNELAILRVQLDRRVVLHIEREMRTTHFIVRNLEDVATGRLIPDIEAASFLLNAEPDGSLFAIRLSNVEIPTADERACLCLQNG